jgi:protein pelota
MTDELIQEYRQKEMYAALEKIMKTVETTGGEIHIITSENEAGQKLQGLGGIAALLRYKKYE